MRTLVAGWFSFSDGHATAGDLLAAELVCDWLAGSGFAVEIATDPPFTGGVNWRQLDPRLYPVVIFVCGPFGNGRLEGEFLTHFSGCKVVGVNLSMMEPLTKWQPFAFLQERDSSERVNADIVFLSQRPLVPLVGLCRVEDYGAMEGVAHRALDQLLAARNVAVIEVDTRLDVNLGGLRTPEAIETALARMDVVVTTRLHATVLALKHGVPALVVDPEAGGAKIVRQMERIGWPAVHAADNLTPDALERSFEFCLTREARDLALQCAARGRELAGEVRKNTVAFLEAAALEPEQTRPVAPRIGVDVAAWGKSPPSPARVGMLAQVRGLLQFVRGRG